MAAAMALASCHLKEGKRSRLTLFHCHQQLHIDFGFMTLFSDFGAAGYQFSVSGQSKRFHSCSSTAHRSLYNRRNLQEQTSSSPGSYRKIAVHNYVRTKPVTTHVSCPFLALQFKRRVGRVTQPTTVFVRNTRE